MFKYTFINFTVVLNKGNKYGKLCRQRSKRITRCKKVRFSRNKVLNFWSSIQTRGVKRVENEEKYRAELKELRKQSAPGVVAAFVFGKDCEGMDIYLEKKAEIDSKYEGKLMCDIVADNGEYIYTAEDLAEIEMMKL